MSERSGQLYRLISGENLPSIYAIPGSPIAYIEDVDAIVLSDLHLGFEESAARGLDYVSGKKSRAVGMFLPKIQLKRVLDVVGEAISLVKAKKVIINGDLKHAFDKLLRQERVEISKLLEFIASSGVEEVVVIRGNHDNYLPIVLREHDLTLYTKYELVTSSYKLLITHGHLDFDPSGYDVVVIGHEHPSIRCLGYQKTPAFMKIPFDRDKHILVLPAVGPYHPGTTISLSRESYLSPVIKKYGDLSRASIVTWVDLSYSDTDLSNDVELDLITIKYYRVGGRRVGLVEFRSLEIAESICESLL